MTKIVVVCGEKNSGKTTWVCAIVEALTKKGLKVGTLKHTHHRHDVSGKDSDRHQLAGALGVVLVSPEGLAIYKPHKEEPCVEKIIKSHFQDYDFVLAEGYRSSILPKIIVDNDPNANPSNIITHVRNITDGKIDSGEVDEVLVKLETYYQV